MRKLYAELAQVVDARLRCLRDGDKTEWATKHEDTIEYLVKQFMPSGSGFDSGTDIDLDKSNGEKLVFTTAYHHMSHGFYDGWTEHTVTVTPSLAFNFTMRISGRNRNDIKDYMYQSFDMALNENCEFALFQRVYAISETRRCKRDDSTVDMWVISVATQPKGCYVVQDESIDKAQARMVEYIKSNRDLVVKLP